MSPTLLKYPTKKTLILNSFLRMCVSFSMGKNFLQKIQKGRNSHHITWGSWITVLTKCFISKSGCFKSSMLCNLFHGKTHIENHVWKAPNSELTRRLETGGARSELGLPRPRTGGGLTGPRPRSEQAAAQHSTRRLGSTVPRNQEYEGNLSINTVQL